MPSRKNLFPASLDVPAPIVATAIACLLGLFVPLAMVTADLPSALPPLRYDASAVFALHARATRAPRVPTYLEESFTTLATAVARRDARATGEAQRAFASLLVDAGGDDRRTRDALREHFLARFLAAVDAGRRDPLVTVARRHGFARDDAPGVSRAAAIAWFDFRFEATGARETLHGDALPLDVLVQRLPPPERRTFVAWALEADCASLLGIPAAAARTAQQITRCASARQDFATLARQLEPSYAHTEARAAIEALRGQGLLALGLHDPEIRAGLEGTAREAFVQSYSLYREVARASPSRRIARLVLGTARAMGE